MCYSSKLDGKNIFEKKNVDNPYASKIYQRKWKCLYNNNLMLGILEDFNCKQVVGFPGLSPCLTEKKRKLTWEKASTELFEPIK